MELAGAKLLEAGLAGNWIRVYVDASERQREAATALAKAAFAVYGRIEAVRNASISFSGRDGRYRVTVDSGKVVEMTTEPGPKYVGLGGISVTGLCEIVQLSAYSS